MDEATISGAIFSEAKAVIEGAATGFLKEHPQVESFLLTATGRLAKAQILKWVTSNPGDLADLQGQIEDEKEAILEETDSVFADISHEAAPLVLTLLKGLFQGFMIAAGIGAKFIK